MLLPNTVSPILLWLSVSMHVRAYVSIYSVCGASRFSYSDENLVFSLGENVTKILNLCFSRKSKLANIFGKKFFVLILLSRAFL